MRRILLTATSFAVLLAATNVQAAETMGTVRSVNTKLDSITLNDGKAYVLPEGIEAESVKAGEKVKITFATNKGENRASSLVRTK